MYSLRLEAQDEKYLADRQQQRRRTVRKATRSAVRAYLHGVAHPPVPSRTPDQGEQLMLDIERQTS